MKLFLILPVLLLAGCDLSHGVSSQSIEKGKEACSSNGGLLFVSVWDTYAYFHCKNGAKFTFMVDDK